MFWDAAGTDAVVVLLGCSLAGYRRKRSKSVPEVRQAGSKGKDPALKGGDSVVGRGGAGEASEADLKLMVDLTWRLTRNSPPQGELASWTEKTSALPAAANVLTAQRSGAIEAWKAATN